MAIETLGEACSQGWRVTVRCAYGRSEGPRSQSVANAITARSSTWRRWSGRGAGRFRSRGWKAACAARAADRAMWWCFTSRRAAPPCVNDVSSS